MKSIKKIREQFKKESGLTNWNFAIKQSLTTLIRKENDMKYVYYFIMLLSSIIVNMQGMILLLSDTYLQNTVNNTFASLILIIFGLITGSRYFGLLWDIDNKLNIRF